MSTTSSNKASSQGAESILKRELPGSTARQSFSSRILFLSIISLVSAVLIAYVLSASASTSDTAATATGNVETGRIRTRFFSSISSRLFAGQPSTAPAASLIQSSFILQQQQTRNNTSVMPRTPVYFLSHGGPNIMYDHDHPAYRKLQEIGREITTQVKPKAVVVFSGHWQAGRDSVQVNTAEITDLIYDFYGFPQHYYQEKYPHVGSKEVAGKVLALLKEAGIKAEGVKRGLDHGVWASFKCAFEPESNPLNVPVVQVSLFGNEDPAMHFRLGQALTRLRDENIQIITSGMAVHNLRDLRFTWGDPRPLPYTVSFDDALKDAVTTPPEKREKAMLDLLKRADARQAHPTFDHLLPLHVGAGAASDDVGKRLFTLNEGSLGWAQFRFGELPAVS